MSATRELTQEEYMDINRSFHEFDKNGNGYITSDEVKKCLEKANLPSIDAIVEHSLKQMDASGDGRVSFAEYLKFMTAVYLGGNKL